MYTSKCLKAGIGGLSLLVTFFFTGWALNWAPLSEMLQGSGFYSNLCEDGSVGCHAQQVAISKLWSAIMLSEFTIFPSGVLMDLIGPILFTIFTGVVHCGSTLLVVAMPKSSPLLIVPFFGCGTAVHASALLAMRTVFVFDSPLGRTRWILMCCTLFDLSAIFTMLYFNLWERHLISIDAVFNSLAVLGMVLFGSLFPLHCLFKYYPQEKTEIDALAVPLKEGELSYVEVKKKPSLREVVTSPAFYFLIFYSAVSIYRIRYFLGIASYTLQRLHDTGFYLQALGYSFCLTIVFSPVVDRILRSLDDIWMQFHLVNIVITLYFSVWLIPNLPVQLLTMSLFVFCRLMFFIVLNDYCSSEFTEHWFGMVMGLGFVAAAIPGSFTYLIVDVALKEFNSNFWFFHLMCILLVIPTCIAICLMQRREKSKPLRERRSSDSDRRLARSSTVLSSGAVEGSNAILSP